MARWQRDAACREWPDLDWHLDEPTPDGLTACRAVCDRCLVEFECLEDAIATFANFGVRGGLTGWERRDLQVPSAR